MAVTWKKLAYEDDIVTTEDYSIYVDSVGGNDANNGSSGSPLATMQRAIDLLPTIIVHNVTIRVSGDHTPAASLTLAGKIVTGTLMIKASDTADNDLYDQGTATAGGNDTLTDGGKAWTVNGWAGGYVGIIKGTGAGQVRTIASNTGTELTVTVNWGVNPDATSMYIIVMSTIDGSATVGLQNTPNNLSVYGFRWTNTTYVFLLTGGITTKLYYNIFNLPVNAAFRLENAAVGARYNLTIIDGTNWGFYARQGAVVEERNNCTISTNAGVGEGLYADNASFISLHSTHKHTYVDLATGIYALNGAIVKGGNLQVFVNCTVDTNPAAAGDPAYIG